MPRCRVTRASPLQVRDGLLTIFARQRRRLQNRRRHCFHDENVAGLSRVENAEIVRGFDPSRTVALILPPVYGSVPRVKSLCKVCHEYPSRDRKRVGRIAKVGDADGVGMNDDRGGCASRSKRTILRPRKIVARKMSCLTVLTAT